LYRVEIRGQAREDVRLRSNIQYRGEDNILYNIGFFDGFRNKLQTIDITSFDPDNNNIVRKLTSLDAQWDGEDNKWIFNDCTVRYFENGEMTKSIFYDEISLDDIKVTPIDFVKSAKSPFSMNYFELKEYIDRLKRVGEKYTSELVDLYTKVSFPFANFIVMLFCVPLVTVSNRSRYRGVIFLIGISICFLYLTVIRICQSLGYNDIIDPFIAAWLPNFIFLGIGTFFVIKSEI